jgi:hypothetical protein
MLFIAQKDARQWLVSLICSDPLQASGACHRSLQLMEILECDGWRLQPIDPPSAPTSRLSTIKHSLRSIVCHGPLLPIGRDSWRSQGHVAHSVHDLHRRFPALRGVIQEGTGFGGLAALAEWHRRGVCTVVVPANIEALAPNHDSWTHRGQDVTQRFANERRWWAVADAIFTISIEEAWWLQLHGIAAEHLPYFPATERAKALTRIASERQPDAEVGWLWLADFRNPANRTGVFMTLQWLKDCIQPPEYLVIAGRGCDWLNSNYGSQLPPYARLLGEVSDVNLQQIYRRCTAQLIVHPATSGMLTRVVDAALAGIPIVGNSMALKSYAAYFADGKVASIPRKPLDEETRFLKQLDS